MFGVLCSAEAVEELTFWSSSLEGYNSRPIWRSSSAVRVVYSDASERVMVVLLLSMGHAYPMASGQQNRPSCLQYGWFWAAVADKLSNCRVRAGLQTTKMLSVFCKWVVESVIFNQ